jgi:hypothetical protein
MYLIDDIDEPGFLVLQDRDRFHCILHSGELDLPDGTTMILVLFVVRRAESGLYDLFIINKFFREDGTVNKTFMSKKNIPANKVDQVVSETSSTFALGLKLQGRIEVHWDKLDLRAVSGKQGQIQRIKAWGKLTSIKVKHRRSF